MSDYTKGRKGRPWRRLTDRLRRQARPCALCGQPIDYTLPATHPDSFTADHILPLSTHPHLARTWTNIQAAHRACNTRKGNGHTNRQIQTSQDW